MDEEWRPVLGWEGYYEVSNKGNVRSLPRRGLVRNRIYGGRLLGKGVDFFGYETVMLCKPQFPQSRKKVHRLVLLAFVGNPPDGTECCHNNGVKTDNRLENLRWGDRFGNIADNISHGKQPRWDKHPMAKLTLQQVANIKNSTKTAAELSRIHGVSTRSIRNIRNGENWVGA